MKCPGCGLFMRLEYNTGKGDTFEQARAQESAFVWVCPRMVDCLASELLAPEMNWRYWGISSSELEGLRAESAEEAEAFDAMKRAYDERARGGRSERRAARARIEPS